jgi:hypothetical protein
MNVTALTKDVVDTGDLQIWFVLTSLCIWVDVYFSWQECGQSCCIYEPVCWLFWDSSLVRQLVSFFPVVSVAFSCGSGPIWYPGSCIHFVWMSSQGVQFQHTGSRLLALQIVCTCWMSGITTALFCAGCVWILHGGRGWCVKVFCTLCGQVTYQVSCWLEHLIM